MLSSARNKPTAVTSSILITGKEATENSSRNPIITIPSKTIYMLINQSYTQKKIKIEVCIHKHIRGKLEIQMFTSKIIKQTTQILLYDLEAKSA